MNWNQFSPFVVTALIACCCCTTTAREKKTTVHGTVRYRPTSVEKNVPQQFRLAEHTFSFQQQPLADVSEDLAVSRITFASPVETPHERNNTVHCEYYRPMKDGKPLPNKAPGVVVLHILGGDFQLSRLFCNMLAHRGVATLFIKMPYYGPRRQPGVARRMISRNPHEIVEGMTQAVLDVRRGVAWLASREEIDNEQLGIFGISLGAITGALAITAEPQLKNSCLLLGGGDIGRLGWESPELADLRRWWTGQGKTHEDYIKLVAQIDPVTYAANARNRRILMLNARDDLVVPKACTESLWRALGEPEIVWYTGGHYSVGRHIFKILYRTGEFFAPSSESSTTAP